MLVLLPKMLVPLPNILVLLPNMLVLPLEMLVPLTSAAHFSAEYCVLDPDKSLNTKYPFLRNSILKMTMPVHYR